MAAIQMVPSSQVIPGGIVQGQVVQGQVVQGQVVQGTVPGGVSNVDADTGTNQGIGTYLGNGVVLRQHTSECCRCFCCQPNIDWDISEWSQEISTLGQDRKGGGAYSVIENSNQLAFVKEDATFCGRTMSWFNPGGRSTTYTYHKGTDQSGDILMTHSKGCTNGVNQVIGCDNSGNVIRCPCCCFLPYLETKDAGGTTVGKSQYLCDECLFVPKYEVLDASGQKKYFVRPDTCICGCCMQIKCCDKNGAKACRIPFYIRDPVTKEKLDSATPDGTKAAMSDLWAGWKAECCTRRDLYELRFPVGATPEDKMALLGLSHLVDITVFEQDE